MIDLNRILGDESEKFRVKMEAIVEFNVGGESHEDRVDSLKMLLDDHYDDIVKCSYFTDGISSLTTEIIGEERSEHEMLSEIIDIMQNDELAEDEKIGKIEDLIHPCDASKR